VGHVVGAYDETLVKGNSMGITKNRRPSKAARILNTSLMRLRAALDTDREAQALREHAAVVASLSCPQPHPTASPPLRDRDAAERRTAQARGCQ